MPNNDEYYTLIQKDEPNTLEEQEIKNYENYIQRVKRYAPYLNEEALENLTSYQRFYETAKMLPQIPNSLQEGIKRYEEMEKTLSILDEKNEKQEKKEQALTLERTKRAKQAGYANGAALLFVVLNLGLFLACLLLFFQ